MKKVKLDAVKLQLKKEKIATLSTAEMVNLNGGTAPQMTPVVALVAFRVVTLSIQYRCTQGTGRL